MNNIHISAIFVLLWLLMSGCSQRGVYETFRHSDKYHCHDIINTEERIRCQNADRATYSEYQEYLKKTDLDGK